MPIRVDRTEVPHLYSITPSYFSPALRAVLKQSPGMRWESHRGQWRAIGYSDAVTLACKLLQERGVLFEGKPPGPPAWQEGWLTTPIADTHLRPYQKEGVRFLVCQAREGALLSDALGLGKTIQAIIAARALKEKTCIVCPSFVRMVWGEELPRWWPAIKNVIATPKGVTPKPIDPKCRVVLIHYDILYAWTDTLLQWGVKTLVLDEGHACMSATSRRSKAVRKLADVAPYRMMLTGTPLTNRIRDLHNVVDTLCPNRFGSFFEFGRRYCNGHQVTIPTKPPKTVWDFDGKSNLEELHERLSFFMLRRTRADVGMQLPARARQIIEVEVGKKFTCDFSVAELWKSSRAMRRTLDLAADGKLDTTIALAKQHAGDGEKVVVYCWRRAFAEAISSAMAVAGIPTGVIYGGVSLDKRKKLLKEAASTQGGHVLVCNIDTVREGISLTYARVGIIAELTWEGHELVQLEGRQYRFGQSSTVLFQYIIGLGCVDEIIRERVIDRLDQSEATVGKEDHRMQEELHIKKQTPDEALHELYLQVRDSLCED